MLMLMCKRIRNFIHKMVRGNRKIQTRGRDVSDPPFFGKGSVLNVPVKQRVWTEHIQTRKLNIFHGHQFYLFVYGLDVSGHAPAALLSRKKADGTVV